MWKHVLHQLTHVSDTFTTNHDNRKSIGSATGLLACEGSTIGESSNLMTFPATD